MKYQNDPDRIGQFNLKLTLGVGFLSLFISGILIGVYYNDKEKNFRDTLSFAVTALATSAGVTSAFYALRSIKQNTESQMIDRTLLYITRWNDPQYLSVRKTAVELHHLISHKSFAEQEKILRDYLDKNPDKKQDITNVLNFLEEMAICMKKGIIKEELLLDFYRFIVTTYCEAFIIFITQNRREKNNDKLYKSLTDLCERWSNL